MKQNITSRLQQKLVTALSELNIDYSGEINLEHPADPDHGDYSSNIALVIPSSKIKNLKLGSRRDLARAIVDQLKTDDQMAKIEIAGPGFINFYLSEAFFLAEMGRIIDKQGDVTHKTNKGQKIVVEFTDPNPFKEFHIGHLYSNTVGESICRILENTGAQVWRADYFGDVGMHAAKSVWGMIKKLQIENSKFKINPKLLKDLISKPLAEKVKFLGQAYAYGATAYKEDKQAAEEIKQFNFLVYKAGQDRLVEEENWQIEVDYGQFIQPEYLKLYEEVKKLYFLGRAWSLEYFESIYQRLGMSFDGYYPESKAGEKGLQVVKQGLKSGVFTKSDGAIIFEGSKHDLHDRVFVNSLGLPTYEAKELVLPELKRNDFNYDKSIIVTGNEINEYFKVLLQALSILEPELAKKTTHLGHGMVRLPEGKMSSRTGKVLTGSWLLDEAKNRVEQIAKDSQTDFEKIGQAAIKYAFLNHSIGSDIVFSFEDSLDFQGNSGPYLQYTFVRCLSVLQKAGKLPETIKDITKPFDILLNLKSYSSYKLNPAEIDILRNLYKYSEVVEQASTLTQPHHIPTYIYQLAQKYNNFYAHNRIIGEESEFRLALTLSVAYILRHGLKLLGIEVVERM